MKDFYGSWWWQKIIFSVYRWVRYEGTLETQIGGVGGAVCVNVK